MGAMSLKFAAPITMRLGERTTIVISLALIAAGLLLFARTPVHASYLMDVLPPALLFGIGAGMSFPSLMGLAMSSATPQDAGLASGLVNTTVQVGGAIGLSVLATLSAARTHTLTVAHGFSTSALNSGFHLAYLVAAVLTGVAIVIAATVLRPTPVAH
jgi:MFS family permease